MSETVAQLVITASAGLATGVLLFVADVLQRIFYDFTPAEFGRFMPLLYRRAGYSVFVVITQSIPFFGLFVYIMFFGFGDMLFIVGMVLFALALVVSSMTNKPIYKSMNDREPGDTEGLAEVRDSLRNANVVRALIALAGFLTMIASFAFDG